VDPAPPPSRIPTAGRPGRAPAPARVANRHVGVFAWRNVRLTQRRVASKSARRAASRNPTVEHGHLHSACIENPAEAAMSAVGKTPPAVDSSRPAEDPTPGGHSIACDRWHRTVLSSCFSAGIPRSGPCAVPDLLERPCGMADSSVRRRSRHFAVDIAKMPLLGQAAMLLLFMSFRRPLPKHECIRTSISPRLPFWLRP
jgi:hypothetical protein